MALSVGTELAALLLAANGAEAGARRAPGGAAAAQPGADALPGFADLLAAATNGEPGLTPAPAPRRSRVWRIRPPCQPPGQR
jgi:hypothetical protein